jgi:hypothetical protein
MLRDLCLPLKHKPAEHQPDEWSPLTLQQTPAGEALLPPSKHIVEYCSLSIQRPEATRAVAKSGIPSV